MIKLTAETSKGRMNTIRKEKYQATKTATVTSQCCFRQLPYWWRRHKVRRKTKIISTVNGAALILNLLRYIEMIFQKGVAKIPVEQTGKIDVLRKILNSTGDQNSLVGKSLVTNEFSSRRGIWVPKYNVPPSTPHHPPPPTVLDPAACQRWISRKEI